MKNYLLSVWDYLRGSYWLIPSLLGLVAFVLGFLVPELDAYVLSFGAILPQSIQTTTSAARVVVSVIASGMFTITGTVFSITVVALSLTSQQFGPRLLRTFMLDTMTQLTLGVFISTGVYSLLILRLIEDQRDTMSAPHLSVALAICMAITSIAVLIVFIHHLAILIQAPQVVRAVVRDLDSALDRLFPESLGEAYDEDWKEDARLDKDSARLCDNSQKLESQLKGYIQGLDEERVLELAEEHQLVIKLLVRPGSFTVRGASLALVWGECDLEELSDQVNSCLLIGNRRTPRQDVGCAIDELVEIAVRSLSPGINDPFTAVNCVDWLGSSLSTLAKRKLPSSFRTGPDGQLRIITPAPTYNEILQTAFSPIRLHARGDLMVMRHMVDALTAIANNTTSIELQEELARHIELICDSASGSACSKADQITVERCREQALLAIA